MENFSEDQLALEKKEFKTKQQPSEYKPWTESTIETPHTKNMIISTIEEELEMAEKLEANVADKILIVARYLEIDPEIIVAIIETESAFNGKATRREPHIVRLAQSRGYYGEKFNKKYAEIAGRSFGYFQILGAHYKQIGYNSLEEFKEKALGPLSSQLTVFTRFCLATPGFLKALRRKNWKTIARVYNGPKYEANRYDTKLIAAYSRAKKYFT